MRVWTDRVVLAVAGVLVLGSTAACSAGASATDTLTLYNAQHEDLVTAMVDGFTKATGIKVDIRSGEDFELANQLIQEGSASPADVFLTENSPAMSLVDKAGLFAPVDSATLKQIPAAYQPSDHNWVGFAARSTVLVYNTRLLAEDQRPASILDLEQPQWQGKFGIAAAGADFQAIASAVLSIKGADATAGWLDGLKSNALIYPNNIAVMAAVNAGEIQAGVIYHYYWYKDQAENGANSANTKLKYFGNQDPGAFLSVSGAGVLKSSSNTANAQRLVEYLTSAAGQQILADSTALEYTLNAEVPANAALPPLTGLDAPVVDPNSLNGPDIVALMQQAGLL